MFKWNHNSKRSGSLPRFISMALVVSTVLFSLGLPLNTEAQEFQRLRDAPTARTGPNSANPNDSDLLGPGLRATVAKIHYKLFRVPQDSGSGASPQHHGHAGLWALAGIGMIALGIWGFTSGYGQACNTQKDIYGNTGTCGEDKVYGALFIAGGGAMLAVAAYQSSSNPPATSRVNKMKVPSSTPLTETTSYGMGTASSQQEAQDAIDAIQNEPHTEAPPVQAVGQNFGGSPSITVHNSTDYVLTVYLSGPTATVMTLVPHGSENATLVSGFYRIGGRVSDTSVEPFLGNASFQGGYRYQETFYVSVQP